MYTIHCTLCNVSSTQYNIQYTQYNVHCTQENVSFILYTVHWNLYFVLCTLGSYPAAQPTMSPQHTVHFLRFTVSLTVFTVQYNIILVQYCQYYSKIMRCMLHTLHVLGCKVCIQNTTVHCAMNSEDILGKIQTKQKN